VSGRGHAKKTLGARGTGVGRPPVVAIAIVALVLFAAAGAAGCGGSRADLGAYVGAWQRVEVGVPNPDFTVTVAVQGDGTAITFADRANSVTTTVAGTAEDGSLACVLPSGDHSLGEAVPPGSPSPGVAPGPSDLRLSIDEDGQLVVDVVLSDGTLEPVLIYDRTPAPSPEP